jgi:hypothetical protein
VSQANPLKALTTKKFGTMVAFWFFCLVCAYGTTDKAVALGFVKAAGWVVVGYLIAQGYEDGQRAAKG